MPDNVHPTASSAHYRTLNPATGVLEHTWPALNDSEIDQALTSMTQAQQRWRATPIADRAKILATTADLLQSRVDELAGIAVTEMGKPVRQAVAEIVLCARIFSYYSEYSAELTEPEPLASSGALKTVVEKEPLGAILGVMPWNFPYYQIARFIAPNMLMGNAIALKPAPICAASALRMNEILIEAGLPADLYQTVLLSNEHVARVIADPRIQGVSFTGSEATGATIARTAGAHLKKTVLELGGSDPMIVLGGDIRATARKAARARLGNAGQACNAPKRIIVLDPHFQLFLDELVSAVESSPIGDPTSPDTHVGPLSSGDARQNLIDIIADAVDHGASVHTGGSAPHGPGFYFHPTVLTGVTPAMRAYREEVFGPVAVVYHAPTIDTAVDLANDSAFGLSGSVWSDDIDLAAATARRLDVGMAFVNEHGTSRPELPFGGIKRSGYGRELGTFGASEFVNHRVVRISEPPAGTR